MSRETATCPIPLLTRRNSAHWCAVGGNFEHLWAAKSGQRRQTVWMQTSGTSLLAVDRCSLAHVWTFAQDSRSAYGLLYLAAVRDDWCQQEHRQVRLDIGLSAWELACHTLLTTVFAGQGRFVLPVDYHHRPSQTLASGTQRARCRSEAV